MAIKLEIDENRKIQQNKIVKSEILSKMEGLQHYSLQQINGLLKTKLIKFEQSENLGVYIMYTCPCVLLNCHHIHSFLF